MEYFISIPKKFGLNLDPGILNRDWTPLFRNLAPQFRDITEYEVSTFLNKLPSDSELANYKQKLNMDNM